MEPGAKGNQRIQIDLDTHKIAEDVEKAGKTVGTAVQGATKGEQPKSQPADFVGPPLPPDMPQPPRVTIAAPPTPGQFTLPTPRRN